MHHRQLSYPTLRLGLVASTFAALSAVMLYGRVAESVIVVGVIVLTSLASWRHAPLAPAVLRPNRRVTVINRPASAHARSLVP